jgi:hypothetical protein
MSTAADVFGLFGAPPAPVAPTRMFTAKPSMNKSPVVSARQREPENANAIQFFLSCSDLHLPCVHRTAQNMLRSVLGNNNISNKSTKPPECMIQVDMKQSNRVPIHGTPKVMTERVRSQNPAFMTGISLKLPGTTPPNSLVCFNIIMTEESANGKSVAYTEVAWLHLLQNFESGASVLYLPLNSSFTDSAVLTLRFSCVLPVSHTLLETQNHVLKCFAFPSTSNKNQGELPMLVSEEMAEVGPSVQIPLIFLRQCRRELEGAYHLWRVRYNNARKRLKHFHSDDDALQNGCDIFKVAVLSARNLVVPVGLKEQQQQQQQQKQKQQQKRPNQSPISPRSLSSGLDSLNLNLNRALKSKPHEENHLRHVERCGLHPFVLLLFHESPLNTPKRTHSDHTHDTETTKNPHWFVVGKTNTEYETTAPVFGTNGNAALAPMQNPTTKHFVSTVLNTRLERGTTQTTDDSSATHFVWYRPSRGQELSGKLEWDICTETEALGPVELGTVSMSLADIRERMVTDATSNQLAFRTRMWLPIQPRCDATSTDDSVSPEANAAGELYVEIQIVLTQVPFAFESEENTHFTGVKAKADDTPLFRLASSTVHDPENHADLHTYV